MQLHGQLAHLPQQGFGIDAGRAVRVLFSLPGHILSRSHHSGLAGSVLSGSRLDGNQVVEALDLAQKPLRGRVIFIKIFLSIGKNPAPAG